MIRLARLGTTQQQLSPRKNHSRCLFFAPNVVATSQQRQSSHSLQQAQPDPLPPNVRLLSGLVKQQQQQQQQQQHSHLWTNGRQAAASTSTSAATTTTKTTTTTSVAAAAAAVAASTSSSSSRTARTTESCWAAAAAVSGALLLLSALIIVAGGGGGDGVDFTLSATPTRTAFCQEQADEAKRDAAAKQEQAQVGDNDDDDDDDDDDENPDNDNPEEEDEEETSCSMCQTFRQGPCGRPYWRKLEACFKRNENVENGNGDATKCMRQFSRHQACLMQFMNLYQLISLHVKQELIRDAELSVSAQERRPAAYCTAIDWSAWISYSQEYGIIDGSGKDVLAVAASSSSTPTATSSSSSSSSSSSNSNGNTTTTRRSSERDSSSLLSSAILPSKKSSTKTNSTKQNTTPLWKRVPENTEPLLLTLTTSMDRFDNETNMLLKVAYVLDQDGMVLGLAYNQAYGDLLQLAESPTPASVSTQDDDGGGDGGGFDNGEKSAAPAAQATTINTEVDQDTTTTTTATANEKGDDNNSSNSHENNKYNVLPLEFVVLPGETHQIQVKALYAENPVEADANKDILDVCLVEGPWISLADVAAKSSSGGKEKKRQAATTTTRR